MKFLSSSIRLKLTVATLVPLAAAIVLCWIIGSSLIITRLYSQAQQTVELDLNSAREMFQGEQARLGDILRLTGHSPELPLLLTSNATTASLPPLQAILRNERLSFLTLVDRYGFVRYRAANPGVMGDSLKQDKMVADALAGVSRGGVALFTPAQALRENPQLPAQMLIPIIPTPHARTYFKKTEERGLLLVAAAPVLDRDNSVIGAMYGGILLNGDHQLVDRICRVLFRTQGSGGQLAGNATLFLDDVRIATTVLNDQGKRATGSMMSGEVYQAISHGERWNGTAYVLNEKNFTAYEPLKDARGTVVGALFVGMPEQPYLDLRARLNLIFSGVLLLVSLIGMALSAWLGSSMARPIKALEEGARRITAGEQLPDIPVEGNDEIGSLAGEFNTMKRRLAQRDEENRNLHRTLEDKVQERTVQLEEKNRELLTAQKELERAERLAGIGMLASGVAHEINNPLAIIRGNTELLEMGLDTGHPNREEVDTIMRQVGRIERIVQNLRAFSRSGRKRLDLFSPIAMLDSILDQVGHQIPLHPYTIVRNYRDTTVTIEGDEDQLRQVLTNLILNALQAMEQGGTLTLSQETTPAHLCRIAVTDTGPGITPEQQEKLFTPFFSTKPQGTGLGLAVSYGIIRDHNGEIEITSQSGQGATFTVLIPLRQPDGSCS